MARAIIGNLTTKATTSTPIRRRAGRRQKNDRRDADLILDLLLKGEFPRVHCPPPASRDVLRLLRKSELLGLRKANLDFDHDLIRVENSRRQRNKSKRPRHVPMNSRAKEILLGLCEATDGEYVFPSKKTGGHVLDVKTGFNAACEDAGIDDLTFHDLRRTAATRLGEAGANAFYIQRSLGHEDPSTSQIYTVATGPTR
jgi:integrase